MLRPFVVTVSVTSNVTIRSVSCWLPSTRETFLRRQIGWPVDLSRETQESLISLFRLGALKLVANNPSHR
jgi:hypothetical protein